MRTDSIDDFRRCFTCITQNLVESDSELQRNLTYRQWVRAMRYHEPVPSVSAIMARLQEWQTHCPQTRDAAWYMWIFSLIEYFTTGQLHERHELHETRLKGDGPRTSILEYIGFDAQTQRVTLLNIFDEDVNMGEILPQAVKQKQLLCFLQDSEGVQPRVHSVTSKHAGYIKFRKFERIFFDPNPLEGYCFSCNEGGEADFVSFVIGFSKAPQVHALCIQPATARHKLVRILRCDSVIDASVFRRTCEQLFGQYLALYQLDPHKYPWREALKDMEQIILKDSSKKPRQALETILRLVRRLEPHCFDEPSSN